MKLPNLSLLEAFAAQNSLQIYANVFHATEGIEVRKSVGTEFICAGCIFGPSENELYRRRLKKRDLVFRSRFWFLGKLFLSKHYLDGNDYERVRTIEKAEWNDEFFVRFVERELLHAD